MSPYKIEITVIPEKVFEVPISDGYQLYSAILNQINKSYPQISSHIHNSNHSALTISSLDGFFKNSNKEGYKILNDTEKYKFNISIICQEELCLFQAITHSLVFDDGKINLLYGSLIVTDLKNTNETFEEIIKKSIIEYDKIFIEFNFKTTTCIQYQNSRVTEMFPHRNAVYLSLLSKWNNVCPEKLRLNLTQDEISRYVIEKPVPESHSTHSVMVSTKYDEKNNKIKPIFKQGFKGQCAYTLTKNTPNHVKNAILVLSKFAEYSGVGSGVSRGCGWVEVMIKEA